MLVDVPAQFAAAWARLPAEPWAPPWPRGVMLMAPEGLSSSAASCADNRYMAVESAVDAARAHAQHRHLAAALAGELPVWSFPGRGETPDAVFLNNAFATVPGRLILGAMRYPERQRETDRADVRAFFTQVLGYGEIDLAGRGFVAELTGALVIDRLRGVGYCGLSERCDLAGAQAMHEAFGLRLTYAFELAPGEYHTNVVMSVLGGAALVLCRSGLRESAAAAAIAAAYGEAVIEIDAPEKNAFAGNCIALRPGGVWMSAAAKAALGGASRAVLARLGWQLRTVDLDEIEKAGGSLRCCIAEVF